MNIPRIYTYKVTFEETPDWYWGVHKEKRYNDGYKGSPVTHAWKWEFYTPILTILEEFPHSEEGWEQACEMEQRLILHDLHNPLCLNEACGGRISTSQRRKGGLTQGKKHLEEGLGLFSAEYKNSNKAKEVSRRNGKNSSSRLMSLKLGIHSPDYLVSPQATKDRSNAGKIGGVVTSAQLWQSTVDGFISNAGNVARHNRANGWDPAAKTKVADTG